MLTDMDSATWASAEAAALAQRVIGYPESTNDAAGRAWIAGLARKLQGMVERNGYTREAAVYEVSSGLGVRSCE